MPGKQKRCDGSGQTAQGTYTRQARTSGGVVRPITAADCPVNPQQHHGLLVYGDNKIQPHAQ